MQAEPTTYRRQLLVRGGIVGIGLGAIIDVVGTDVHGTGLTATSDRVKQQVKLEDDRPTVLREAIKCCRKGGTLSVPGVYVGRADNFPIGSVMNKALTIKTG